MNDDVRNATASATDSLWRAANEARRRAEAEQPYPVDPDCNFAVVDTEHRCVNRNGEPVREGQSCWINARQALMIERLTAKVAGLPDDECWPWQGALDDKGYGLTSVFGKQKRAHRAIYEIVIGPIPDGLQLDHVCHTRDPMCPGGPTCLHRRCVNPTHLDPVTCQENLARSDLTMQAQRRAQTHCKHGHEFTSENTYVTKAGLRQCRACHRRREAERQRRLQREFIAVSDLDKTLVERLYPPCLDESSQDTCP